MAGLVCISAVICLPSLSLHMLSHSPPVIVPKRDNPSAHELIKRHKLLKYSNKCYFIICMILS